MDKDVTAMFGPGQLFEGAVLINLDSRPERLHSARTELQAHGIDTFTTRLSAFAHENGMYGCSVSHIEAVKLARRNGWKSVVIFEDDIRITDAFTRFAAATLSDLAQLEWGLFQFGMMNPLPVEFVTRHLFRFTGGAAAHAFALHERTYDYLIDNYVCALDRGNWEEPAHLPFDEYLNNQFCHQFDSFGATKLLISQHPGLSDTWAIDVDYGCELESFYAHIHAPPSTIRLAGTELSVDWKRWEHGKLLTFLFGAARSESQSTADSDFRIELTESDQHELHRGAECVYRSGCKGALALRLLESVRQHAVQDCGSGILVNASALGFETGVVIFPAGAGTDNSKLITALSHAAPSRLIGDTLVYLPQGTLTVRGLGAALGVTEDANEPPDDRPELSPDVEQRVLPTPSGNLGSAALCDNVAEFQATVLRVIVFCQRPGEIQPELHALSGAQTLVRLLDTVANRVNLPAHGFSELARIARNVPAYELSYSDAANGGDLVIDLLGNLINAE